MTRTNTLAIPKPAQVALLAAGVTATVVAGRLMRKRSATPAERLAATLLDTSMLESARREAHERPERAITDCARYALHLAAESAGAVTTRSGAEAAGTSCKSVHPYSGARAAVLVRRVRPSEELVLSLDFDGVANVRGARTVGPVRLAGVTPARRIEDRLQFDLGEMQTIQIEAVLSVSDFVATGTARIQGEMTLESSAGVAGAMTILPDGSVTGALRRAGKVLGRFAGSMSAGVQYLSFYSELETGDRVA